MINTCKVENKKTSNFWGLIISIGTSLLLRETEYEYCLSVLFNNLILFTCYSFTLKKNLASDANVKGNLSRVLDFIWYTNSFRWKWITCIKYMRNQSTILILTCAIHTLMSINSNIYLCFSYLYKKNLSI